MAGFNETKDCRQDFVVLFARPFTQPLPPPPWLWWLGKGSSKQHTEPINAEMTWLYAVIGAKKLFP